MTTIVSRKASKSPPFSKALIVYWAERMLNVLGRGDAELSVLLADDKTIQHLNLTYRQKDRPTDVLSFHFESVGLPSHIEAGWLLGDIVISLDTAARQAIGRKRSLEAEVRWLLAHGILHLVGYDHATPEEKRVMVAMTGKLVRNAGDPPKGLGTLRDTKEREVTKTLSPAAPQTTRSRAPAKKTARTRKAAPLIARPTRATVASKQSPRAMTSSKPTHTRGTVKKSPRTMKASKPAHTRKATRNSTPPRSRP